MGKVLIIKDADFSANKVDKIDIEGEPVVIEQSVLTPTGHYDDATGKWINSTNLQSYYIAVEEGKTYKVDGSGLTPSGQGNAGLVRGGIYASVPPAVGAVPVQAIVQPNPGGIKTNVFQFVASASGYFAFGYIKTDPGKVVIYKMP